MLYKRERTDVVSVDWDKSLDVEGTMKIGTAEMFYCFTRTWWKDNPDWPDGREPGAGPRHTVARHMTWTEARAFCDQWNSAHNPGRLSKKCEFDRE